MGRRVIKQTEVVGPVSMDSKILNVTEVDLLVKKDKYVCVCSALLYMYTVYII